MLAEAVAKSIALATKEKGDKEALEQRLTAVIENRGAGIRIGMWVLGVD
jgi:hypothetical protein